MKAPRICTLICAFALPHASASQSDLSLAERAELPAHETFITQNADAQLAPFTTDGCSGGMSDIWTATAAQFPGWAKTQGEVPPWEACCVAHDRAYHKADVTADARQSFAARLAADDALRACVIAQGEKDRTMLTRDFNVSAQTIDFVYAGIAQGMYFAVRLGGGPCSGLPWRWGYGYPNCSVVHRLFSDRDPASQ